MKRLRSILFWLILPAIVIALTINRLLPDTRTSGAQPGGAAPALSVKATIVRPARLENKIQATGTIIANEEVEMRTETAGRITNLYFKEGSRVSKNDLLLKINDQELRAQMERVQSQIKLAESNEQRQRGLLDKNLASQNDYDVALNALNVAKADLELVKAQLAKTELRAPFDGIIGLKYISEGSYISSATRIASIQNISVLKIDFAVPEKYAGMVNSGNPINFRIQESPTLYKGKVFAVEPKIDLATRTVQLRALVTESDQRVIPGAFAKVELILKDTDNALMIPTQALIPELKGQRVLLYRSGKVVSQKVEIGMRTEANIQITDGLKPSDTVLVTGIMQLRPGMSVTLSEIN